MIPYLVEFVFSHIGHRWSTGNGLIAPDEEDVKIVLDEAAKVLYDSPVGTRFESAGLIVEKRPDGFDTWVYVGNYH